MSLRIAIAGKGGSGKTTVAALLCRSLLERQIKPLLAVDADPNSCLPEKLGIAVSQTIGDLREELRRHPEKKPAAISKNEWMEDLINRSLTEATGFDLVVMGRQEGPDCYCFINHLLRHCLEKIAKTYRAVVIDNEAGLEHLSRRSNGPVEILIVVANPTIDGARTAVRIMELVKSLSLEIGYCGLVLNQSNLELSENLQSEFKRCGLDIIADIPTDPVVGEYESKGLSLLTVPKQSGAARAVEEMLNKLLERRNT